MLNIIRALSKYGEVLAGDSKESKLANEIKAILIESKVDQTIISPIKVINWKEKYARIICNGYEIPAVALVYSPSGSFKVKNSRIVRTTNPLRLNIEYNKAVAENLDGLIITFDNIMRRLILTFGKPLQNFGLPPPIPAVYIRDIDLQRLNEECEITTETSFNTNATSYIIEGIINSRKEKPIFITAHHDHFFTGAYDNLTGIALLTEIPKITHNIKQEVRLISFTAHETGSPFFTLHWSYGSKYFIQNVTSVDPNSISLCINLETITPNYKIYYSPFLLQASENNYLGFSDCYPFLKEGVPSIMLGDLGYPYKHSELDQLNDNINLTHFNDIINSIQKFITTIDMSKYINLNSLIEFQKFLPLELKSYFVNIIDNINNDINVYRGILKTVGIISDLEDIFTLDPLYKVVYLTKLLRGEKSKLYAEDYINLNEVYTHETEPNYQELFSQSILALISSEAKKYLNLLNKLTMEKYS